MLFRLWRLGTACVLIAVMLVAPAGPAAAHAELISSSPADQAVVESAPAQIKLLFSTQVRSAGDGIVLTAASGREVEVQVTQPSDERLLVRPSRILADGVYLVSWTVQAGDTHPRSGSVGFAVAPEQAAGEEQSGGAAVGSSRSSDLQAVEAPSSSMESEGTSSAEWLGRAARWLSLLGALLGIGVLAFAASSLKGSVREVSEAGFWVRRAGLAVVIGTVLESLTTSAQLRGSLIGGFTPAALIDALSGPFGLAVLLRMAGGAAMLFGARLAATPAPAFTGTHASQGSSGTGAAVAAAPRREESTHKLNVGKSGIALVGAAAVTLSYVFDGHTVTAEPTWVVKVADVAHVFGAGVWVGGVAMMAWVLRRRSRRRTTLRAGELAITFSSVAAVALIVVAAAGTALSFSILDAPRELLSTGFGRLLSLKVLAVGAAAAIGGYNHRFVVPRLATSRSEDAAAERLRTTVRMEAWILVAVVGITAVLVAAAT